MLKQQQQAQQREYPSDPLPSLATLTIVVEQPTISIPTKGTNESYQLTITSEGASLTAVTYVGALRGLETFSQMVLLGMVSEYL